MGDGGDSRCGCKVGRNAARYGLAGLDEEIRRRRVSDQSSLRDLAEYVNVRIIEAVLDDTGADVAGDATSIFKALTESEDPDRRVDVSDRLAAVGIDVGELEDNFVSYQAVRHHLQKCLGIDTSRDGIETVEEGREVLHWAHDQHQRVVERTLARLRRQGALDSGDLDATVSVTVTCENCGTVYHVDEFLDEPTCECRDGG